MDGRPSNTLLQKSLTEICYALRDSKGKGKGLFAIGSIECGTRITAEPPLLRLGGTNPSQFDVERAFNQLSAPNQESFLQLASCHNSDPRAWADGTSPEPHCAAASLERSIYTIYQTNCVDISDSNGPEAAVFKTASRINHSCVPNCCHTWNPLSKMQTIHAIRDIDDGEELSLAYCSLLRGKAERRESLMDYGFICYCEACQDEDTVCQVCIELFECLLTLRLRRGPPRAKKVLIVTTRKMLRIRTRQAMCAAAALLTFGVSPKNTTTCLTWIRNLVRILP